MEILDDLYPLLFFRSKELGQFLSMFFYYIFYYLLRYTKDFIWLT